MNIFDVIKAVDNDPRKKFSNGWNTIEHGDDEYEIKVRDKDGNCIVVLLSGYSYCK